MAKRMSISTIELGDFRIDRAHEAHASDLGVAAWACRSIPIVESGVRKDGFQSCKHGAGSPSHAHYLCRGANQEYQEHHSNRCLQA